MRIYLDQDRESHHIQISGATGTRKSTVIRRLVYQAKARGWSCVFLDKKREYLKEFWKPGAWVIDPFDDRCPRFDLSNEGENEGDMMAVGEGAFPDQPGSQYFFKDHTRAIFAYLLNRWKPRTSELAKWLIYPKLLDSKVQGSEHEVTLSENSPEQRGGILGTLNHLGRALRWMPDEDDGRPVFCVREWAKTSRNGDIFLSSFPATAAGLRPLQSLIFDLCLLNLMSFDGPPVLVVADEIASFQRSPQLEQALSMMRSKGCVIVVAYQSASQIVATYGEEVSKSIFNNPYYSIIFRQYGSSADTASKILSSPVPLERARESRPSSLFRGWLDRGAMHGSYQQERVAEAPVSAAELETLEDGQGYIRKPGMITKLHIKWSPIVEIAPARIPREIKPMTDTFVAKPATLTSKRKKSQFFDKTKKRANVTVMDDEDPGMEPEPEPQDMRPGDLF